MRDGTLKVIYGILLAANGSVVTADQMALGANVSVRTVYRYIAVMKAMHLRIEGEKGVGYILREKVRG